MKITLDSKAMHALMESLTPEARLEFQSAVIQEFANKYLKSVVATREMQKAINAIQQEAAKLIESQVVATRPRWSDPSKIAPWVKDLIVKCMQEANTEAARNTGKTLAAEYEEKVKDLIDYQYRNQTRKAVEKEVDALVADDEYIQGLIKTKAMKLLEDKLK